MISRVQLIASMEDPIFPRLRILFLKIVKRILLACEVKPHSTECIPSCLDIGCFSLHRRCDLFNIFTKISGDKIIDIVFDQVVILFAVYKLIEVFMILPMFTIKDLTNRKIVVLACFRPKIAPNIFIVVRMHLRHELIVVFVKLIL